MPYTVKLPPDVMARAGWTATERPKNILHHKPSADPHADLVGALAEHAFAHHCGISEMLIDSSGGPHGRGDGGWDFFFKNNTVKVDIKSSRKHPESWVVPLGNLRSDWYVFAYVILPDTIIFQGKAHKMTLEPMTESGSVKGKRLVYLTEVEDIKPSDFKTVIPKRPKAAAIEAAH